MPWIIVVLVVLAALIYWFQLRFAAEKQVALAPGGKELRERGHREGVYPQTRSVQPFKIGSDQSTGEKAIQRLSSGWSK